MVSLLLARVAVIGRVLFVAGTDAVHVIAPRSADLVLLLPAPPPAGVVVVGLEILRHSRRVSPSVGISLLISTQKISKNPDQFPHQQKTIDTSNQHEGVVNRRPYKSE